jgi:hypothetical protein
MIILSSYSTLPFHCVNIEEIGKYVYVWKKSKNGEVKIPLSYGVDTEVNGQAGSGK